MKYHLYDKHRQFLKDKRGIKGKGYSAEEVSEMLGHHKSWLGQIERGRLVSIKQEDLINLLSILLDLPKEKISDDMLEKFKYNYDPFYEEPKEPLIDKIWDKIFDIFPNSDISNISLELSDAFTTLNKAAKNLDSKERDIYWLMLYYFNKNLSKDVMNTMAFASLPYHLLFQKYEDDASTLQEIFNHIAKYLEEWIDKEPE